MSRKHAWLVSANKARLMGLALAFALVPAPRVRAQSDESNDRITIVHGGTLLQVPGQPPQERRSIVILSDRIDRVMSGYVTADSLDFDDAEVIDLRDYFVLPGLMDMHVHFTNGRLPNTVPDEAADVYRMTIGIVNARKTLRAGYTTVRNPGARGWSIFALRDGINNGDLEGPRMFVAGHTIRIGTEGGRARVSASRAAARRCGGKFAWAPTSSKSMRPAAVDSRALTRMRRRCS